MIAPFFWQLCRGKKNKLYNASDELYHFSEHDLKKNENHAFAISPQL